MPKLRLALLSNPKRPDLSAIYAGDRMIGTVVLLGSGPAAAIRLSLRWAIPGAPHEWFRADIAALVASFAIDLAAHFKTFPEVQELGTFELPEEAPQ